ncbi:hypothetical protein P4159_00525 [Bacillus thuringiensis]|uniref:Uncharacterized protein n=1 Tax=Bacillus thuringiensis subsp. kurstaki TaxID=29339 RepID=Q3YN36_BACTK|nr:MULTISPECIES: hypothetical protein [Bacillus cereus group]MEB9963597.1 hypothetical protein [Bacillus cereus]AAZ06609.1 hypothetical protein pAW63_039 [Bacillus thuringiensis serovar kurstaki]AGE81686.1 hypothetical protein HD73_7539 [Bacillus thuringiensis serovar kurstaki str. HD73]AND11267.1 hypothetical protein Bt4C1_28845 [Bacillus thuringiensis serovar alesti]EJV73151.1 hypothetical protein IG1_05900 [Bacillus cereus HD73]
MTVVAKFHFTSGLIRSTIIKAESIEEASEYIYGKFEDVGQALFEVDKTNSDNFMSEKVKEFEVFRNHVMFIDYEVQ